MAWGAYKDHLNFGTLQREDREMQYFVESGREMQYFVESGREMQYFVESGREM